MCGIAVRSYPGFLCSHIGRLPEAACKLLSVFCESSQRMILDDSWLPTSNAVFVLLTMKKSISTVLANKKLFPKKKLFLIAFGFENMVLTSSSSTLLL